jgi:hypothetical protein
MSFYSPHISLRLCLIRFEQPIISYHSSNLARKFPSASLAMFSGIAKICFRIAILRSSMVRGLVVYTFALRYTKGKNHRQRG